MREFDVVVMTPVQRDILAHQEVARQPMGRCLVVQLRQVEVPLMDSFWGQAYRSVLQQHILRINQYTS